MGRIPHARHEIVAQEIAAGKSPGEASRRAGYDDKASSFEPNARKRAQHPAIRARVAELTQRAADLAEVDRGYVIARLKHYTDFNLADYLVKGEDGRLLFDISQCTREQIGRLAEITQRVEETAAKDGEGGGTRRLVHTRIKGIDPLAALAQIARIIGADKDPVAETISSIGERLDAAARRFAQLGSSGD